MQQALIVIGAGGHGTEILSYLRAHDYGVQLAGYLDDACPAGPWRGTAILGGVADLDRLMRFGSLDRGCYITAVGSNATRRKLVESIQTIADNRLRAWTLRHPNVQIGEDVTIGEGTCLAPGAIITAKARIGRHVIVNVKVSVSHDCAIGDFVNLNPGSTICGEVVIGEGSYIGAGATVIDKVTIGEWTVVGAGSVVTVDLPAGVTAVGAPARIVKP